MNESGNFPLHLPLSYTPPQLQVEAEGSGGGGQVSGKLLKEDMSPGPTKGEWEREGREVPPTLPAWGEGVDGNL